MWVSKIFDQSRPAGDPFQRAPVERAARARAARGGLAARQRTAGVLLPAALLSLLLALGPFAAGLVDWLAIAVQLSRLMVPR